MGCPQCQNSEISPSGVCLICGYRVAGDSPFPDPEPAGSAPTPEASDSSAPAETAEEDSEDRRPTMIEMDYSEGTAESPEQGEVPRWRQELSLRLHEIKQKRESQAVPQPEGKAAAAPVSQARAQESLSALQARLLEKAPARKPQPPPAPPPRQKTLEPLESGIAAAAAPPALPVNAAEPRDIRSVIDNAVSRQAPSAGPLPAATSIFEQPVVKEQEGKLILLSRTLSGLVDLIVIILCTGAFIIAADFFSGIIALDQISLAYFALLFLLTYFLYSIFFLSASNQTIGMMITELRVAGADDRRPSVGQLLRRCFGFLASLFVFGLGLLSSLFDPENRCFHDRVSGTRVVRL